MIGSQADAERAVAGTLEFLNSGCDRFVYRKGNVVYKVHTEDGHEDTANQREIANYIRLVGILPDNMRVPQTTLYWVDEHPVIAQEYIDGQTLAECWCLPDEPHTDSCMPYDIATTFHPYLNDTGGMNIILRDGIYYLIDLGE